MKTIHFINKVFFFNSMNFHIFRLCRQFWFVCIQFYEMWGKRRLEMRWWPMLSKFIWRA